MTNRDQHTLFSLYALSARPLSLTLIPVLCGNYVLVTTKKLSDCRSNRMSDATLGERFTFPGTSLTVHRIGYGAMQLAGPARGGRPRI